MSLSRNHRIALYLVAVTLLAAFLRFYKLDSLPPGLFGDEALVTIHAREIAQSGNYPIYVVQADGGFHPAVVYLTILFRWLTGNHPYAIRFAMAVVSVATVPLAFFAFRSIFKLDYSQERSEILAGLGTFILAITFPFVLVSRVGFEVTLPVGASLLVFWALSHALRTKNWRHYALAGAFLGAALYTYYAARLLPFALVIAIVWVALVEGRAIWKRSILNLAVVTLASVIVFAPLAWFFIQNPQTFFARAATTSEQTLGQGGGSLLFTLGNATARTLISLSVNGFGDFIPRHNLPLRAVFDPFLSVVFWAGLILSIIQFRRRSSALLIPWMGIMLLPVILTFTLNHPHFTRMMGAMPAFAGLAAVGALALYDVLARRRLALGYAAVGLGLAFSLLVTTYDYFVRWANDLSLYDAFQVGDWNAATEALTESQDHTVYIAPEIITDPSHASFILLLKDGPVRHFPGSDCLVYQDHPARPLTYMVDAINDKVTFDTAARRFPTGHEGNTVFHPNGWPLYQVYEVPAGAQAVPPQVMVNAVFGDELKLLGYDLATSSAQPGGVVEITLYWQAQRNLTADDAVFVHIYPPAPDANFQIPPIAQSDGFPCNGRYATSRWLAGEIVTDTRLITLPPDLPTGNLTLAVGVYEWTSVQRLEIADAGLATALPESRLQLFDLATAP